LKNLWWKEWRETRGLLIVGMAAVAGTFIVPLITDPGGAAWDGLAMSLVVASLFATLSAAGRFAGEAQVGTLSFLLAQPVSRWKVWLVKMGVAFLSVIPLWAFTALLHVTVLTLFPHNDSPNEVAMFTFGSSVIGTLVIIPITLLLSTLLDKPVLSALGGFTGMIAAIMWANRVAGWIFSPRGVTVWTRRQEVITWVIMLVLGAACLAVSALVFTRGQRVHGFTSSWVHGATETRTREYPNT
jgi:ABC-type transport system involved in multi-copper enzyme maturation permease subunit